MRTVNGQLAESFKEACRLRNLLDDDEEWRRCLQEAALARMPYQMRQLFVTLCVFCNVTNALELWNEFKDGMAEDYARLRDATTAERICLNSIEEQLRAQGYSCNMIGLPTPVPLPPELTLPSDGHFDDRDLEEFASTGERNMRSMNEDQRRAETAIFDAVANANSTAGNAPRGNSFFIDGPGGTGKPFLFSDERAA